MPALACIKSEGRILDVCSRGGEKRRLCLITLCKEFKDVPFPIPLVLSVWL